MPKPTIDVLLADPDFQSMDIEGQREILGEVSPAFKGFTIEKQNAALADVSNLRNSSNVDPEANQARTNPADFPGMGQFPTEAPSILERTLASSVVPGSSSIREAQDKAAALIYGGAEALGEAPGGLASIIEKSTPGIQLAQLIPSLRERIKGGISSLQDLTPKAVRAAGFDPNDPENPQFQFPAVSGLGEFIVNAAGGELAGARNVARNVAVPTVKSLEKSGIVKSTDALATGLLKPSGEGEILKFADDIQNGVIDNSLRIIRKEGSWDDMPSMVSKGEKSLDNLADKFNGSLKENGNVKFNNSDIADDMVIQVSSDPLLLERNPEIINTIQSNASNIRKDMTVRDMFDSLKSINRRHKNYHTASQRAQTTRMMDEEFAADEILRKGLSQKLDNFFKGSSGEDANAFREYGAVNGIVNDVRNTLKKETVKRLAEIERGGPISTALTEFDITKPLRSFGAPVTYVRGGELGRLNRTAKELSSKLSPRESPRILTESERAQKLSDVIEELSK